jgi:hypothetical protein
MLQKSKSIDNSGLVASQARSYVEPILKKKKAELIKAKMLGLH